MEPIRVCGIDPGRPLTAYRVVDPADVLASLRSNYERGKAPRRHERTATVIHMGLSFYSTEFGAARTAGRFPQIGSAVAAVRLDAGHGFNYAATGPGGHLTVWGDPVKLRLAIVAIRVVS
jgi:hypothetical protein